MPLVGPDFDLIKTVKTFAGRWENIYTPPQGFTALPRERERDGARADERTSGQRTVRDSGEQLAADNSVKGSRMLLLHGTARHGTAQRQVGPRANLGGMTHQEFRH